MHKTIPGAVAMAVVLAFAPSAASAQQASNYVSCITQLDEMVADIERYDPSWIYVEDELAEYFSPGRLIDQGVANYVYETTVIVSNSFGTGNETEMLVPFYNFAIRAQDGQFSCALSKVIQDTIASDTVVYQIDLPLSTASEVNRWHAAFVRTTRHLSRLSGW